MSENESVVWRFSWLSLSLMLIACAFLFFIFENGLAQMVDTWSRKEEYGHGYMIPFISLFLIWQKKDALEKIEFSGSWLAILAVLVGFLFFFAGELGSHYAAIQYAFLIVLYGSALSMLGWRAFRVVMIPLAILFFMIPLPNFVFNTLSSKLQLISSEIGVAVIRLFDISVYLEGNVIDLGVYKLQVVEACSGLNYLFPLMTLGFITAYFFTGEFWKKTIIFLSTIPITVLMNSFRIGVIGVTVEYWGVEMAEGFLHDFEGWVVFMGCIGILLIEMWILARLGKNKLPLREAFGLDFPEPTPDGAVIKRRQPPKQFIVSIIIIVIAASMMVALPNREEIKPERKQLVTFPLEISDWIGTSSKLESNILDALDYPDYAVIDYVNTDSEYINFYTAYYSSQRKGEAIHSPRACIPGGGWQIKSITEYPVDGVNIGQVPLKVRRLVIEKDNIKQLVYYWFQQRGRVLTYEYQLKWYLFQDAVMKSRTDGALVRLTTVLRPGQDISIADDRLRSFLVEISPLMQEYIPD